MTDQPQTALPMFYTSPRPLDRVRDAQIRISRPTHFNFASKTNAIPVLLDEFLFAAANYPIVFAAGPSPVPAAITGLKNDVNLFIDAKGQWKNASYLPAYVRRYPFILMDDPAQKQFVLCVDEACEFLSPKGEFPLFDGEKPSTFTQGVVDFCATLRQQGELTDAFVKELVEHKLLIAHDAQIDLPNGTKLQLGGFQVIDRAKFEALPDNVFLAWRKKGYVGAVYAHFLSMNKWQDLVELSRTAA